MEQNKIEIQLGSGLSADTPLIIGDELKSIRSVFLAGSVVPTYGLNQQLVPVETEITSIPKEVYVSEQWELYFSNGLKLICTPSTIIYGATGPVTACNIHPKDCILGAYLKSDSGEIRGRVFECVNSQKKTTVLAEPMYYFISKDTNILIPNFANNELTFICVHQ